jgi:hypothetical protein
VNVPERKLAVLKLGVSSTLLASPNLGGKVAAEVAHALSLSCHCSGADPWNLGRVPFGV